MTGARAHASADVLGTPLVHKLGIQRSARVALLNAPDGFDSQLVELPPGVSIRRRARGRLDLIIVFARRRATLERQLPRLGQALEPAGGLWVAWPKRASGVPSDLSDDVVRQLGLSAGLVDNKVCAINELWSALRFVYRLQDRRR